MFPLIHLDPSVSTILVKGLPGTGKSTFALELLKNYPGGTYIATRVSKEKLALQIPQITMAVTEGAETEYSIDGKPLDAVDFRLANSENVVQHVIEAERKSPNGLVVIDSWDSIGKELDRTERLKVEKTLVSLAQSSDSKLVFVSERPGLTTFDYLVDMIIELSAETHNGQIRRQLQIVKSRGEENKEPFALFTLSGGRFTEAPKLKIKFPGEYQAKPFNPSKATQRSFATGIPTADAMPGGAAPRGSTVLLEKGIEVPTTSIVPFAQMFQANFVANGGCVMTIPGVGVTTELIVNLLKVLVPTDAIKKSLRVGTYNAKNKLYDVALNPESLDDTFDRIWAAIDELKGPKKRPCHLWISISKIEYMHGTAGLMKRIVELIENIRAAGDFCLLLVGDNSESKNSIASMVDSHILFEMVANTLTVQSLKPNGGIAAVGFDFSKGYPSINVVPIR